MSTNLALVSNESKLTSNVSEPVPQEASAKKPIGRAGLYALLIIVATSLAYRHSFQGAMVFDDHPSIGRNKSIDEFFPEEKDIPYGLAGRPVGRMSLTLNYKLGKFEVFGYHLLNLVIHLATALVLFDLVRRTLKLPGLADRYAGKAETIALAVALLWAVHPLATQAVTYIVQRLEAIMALSYLLTIYCLLRGALATRGWPWYAGAMLACLIGSGTKEVIVTAPILALLFDRIFLCDSWRELLKKRWAVYAGLLLSLAPLAWKFIGGEKAVEVSGAGFGISTISSWEYLCSQPQVILHYLRLCFWPDQLSIDYMWPKATSPWDIYPAGLAILAMLTVCGLLFWKAPRVGLVAFSFFLILAPTSSFMPIVDLAFEHRMYLPLAAIVILAVLAGDWLIEKLRDPQVRRLMPVAAIAVPALFLGLRTDQRNRDYVEPWRLWQTAVDISPKNHRAQYNLGVALAKAGRPEEAIAAYSAALSANPNHSDAQYNLAIRLSEKGSIEEAMAQYQGLLSRGSISASAAFNLGGLHDQRKEPELAMKYYRQALEIKPDHAKAHANLAVLLGKANQLDDARHHFAESLRLEPELPVYRVQYAEFLNDQRQSDAAIEQSRLAIKLAKKAPRAYMQLARALLEQGKLEESNAALAESLRLDPEVKGGVELQEKLRARQSTAKEPAGAR